VSAGAPPQTAASDGYMAMSATARTTARIKTKGGRVRLTAVTGEATLWVNGTQAAIKASPETGPLEAALAPGAGYVELALLFKVKQGETPGLPGVVLVEAIETA
jgi:beta-galactosidase